MSRESICTILQVCAEFSSLSDVYSDLGAICETPGTLITKFIMEVNNLRADERYTIVEEHCETVKTDTEPSVTQSEREAITSSATIVLHSRR